MIRSLAFLLLSIVFTTQASAAPPACDMLKKQAAASPGFLASYPADRSKELGNVAFLYDNAVAVIALVSCGDAKAASRIGDAILAAQNNDRHFRDGRLRNAYPAGRVDKPAKLTGWWDAKQNMWVEDQYQVGSDTGNQAWAMLALLTLHKAGAGDGYLTGAKRIGVYLEKSFDTRSPAGFAGGAFGGEPYPKRNGWKSTEHNTDLVAAYRLLADATKDKRWVRRAADATAFVKTMWSDACRCFLAGTGEDGRTLNRQLALDAQIWPLLTFREEKYSGALQTAARRLKSGNGFAYSEAAMGFWTEGTAQVGLLLGLRGETRNAQDLLKEAERHRSKDGYYATGTSGVATGFGLETDPGRQRRYFRTPHLAALGWVVLAQQGFNPFTGTRALPAR